ncbi:Trafficking kinesin-binding protein 1 [Folsomia candida]|uniref:Trafficking kinesin-binding protein 1 n=1 Tax=Folsomia candida TaxID=158441 RepID=A0A226EVH1_FOLCA|nr:Trafficking kinesin-binding protein 1 [Folsomia candida]
MNAIVEIKEKEKDLELAARIGQQLLEQNQSLREKVTSLETENKESVECITQLKYELNFKAQLLDTLYNDTTDSAETSKAGTPVGTGVATVLERRMQLLEEENKALRADACQLAEGNDDLERKTEEVKIQQEELNCLEEELKAFQQVNRELVDENTELRKVVEVLSSNQNQLGTELIDLKENYVEVVSILKETQEQLREAQRQKEEGADVVTVFDSLAYEIDSSVARHRRSSDYFRRTFDTVRCANSKLPLTSSALITTASFLASSGLPSLDSSSSHELMNSNFNSLVLESGLGSSLCYSPGSSTPGGTWRLPEKLQIVKPLEGSSTLQVWSSLATPHLGNLLDKRPGVQTRVERPVEGIGANTILALTSEPHTLGTPAVFTFVTTSSIRDSTTTIFSTNISSRASTCSLSSAHSESDSHSPIPSFSSSREKNGHKPGTSASFYASGDYLKSCETPQNSPMEGNSRPLSPSSHHGGGGDFESSSKNKTIKTLYAVYDSLCNKIGGLGNPARTLNSRLDFAPSSSPQKYDLTTKLGRLEVSFESSRLHAPPKPGTGALEKILLEPD